MLILLANQPAETSYQTAAAQRLACSVSCTADTPEVPSIATSGGAMRVYVPDKSPFPMPSAPAYEGIVLICHSISSKTSSTSYTVMQPSNSYHFEPPYPITPPPYKKSLPYPSTPPNQKPLPYSSTPLPHPKAHIPYPATSPYQKSQPYPATSPYQNPLPYPSAPPPNKNQLLVQVHFLHEAKNNYLILQHFPQTSTHYLIQLHLLQIRSHHLIQMLLQSNIHQSFQCNKLQCNNSLPNDTSSSSRTLLSNYAMS